MMGMMQGNGGFGGGQGMMGGGMMEMMGADDGEPGVDPGPAPKRLTAAEVAKAVDAYLAQNYNNPDLEVVELMEFEKNFYAQVAEKSTEINAFELLIDPYTGAVWPEYGPNMMWNTKYGHMSGMGGMMMQGWGGKGIGEPTADMPVNLDQARKNAQAYLDARKSGLTIEEDTDIFYGYYTVHTLDKDGNTVGMLSVNGYTGRVWYHTWHGKFIGMAERHVVRYAASQDLSGFETHRSGNSLTSGNLTGLRNLNTRKSTGATAMSRRCYPPKPTLSDP